jgi:tRNA pseudouridine38-40 synthase
LRAALARTLRLEPAPQLTVAGRTDAGVHALAQVVSADLPDPLFPDGDHAEKLARAIHAQLSGRVTITAMTRAPAEFDARHSALWRAYRYLVVESAAPAISLTSAVAWVVPGPFDQTALEAATALVVGVHDFGSFCRRPSGDPDATLVREVLDARWRVVVDPLALAPSKARWWRLDIRANAFCHQMVRSLTADLIEVARGRQSVDAFRQHLTHPDRQGLSPPAPPAGLALVGVGYPPFAGGPSGPVSLEVPRGRPDVATA